MPEVLIKISDSFHASTGENGEVEIYQATQSGKFIKYHNGKSLEIQSQWVKEFERYIKNSEYKIQEVYELLGIKKRTFDGYKNKNLPFHQLAKMIQILKQLRFLRKGEISRVAYLLEYKSR